MSKNKIKVMWLIKSLNVGGAEQLLANSVDFIDRSKFTYEIAYVVTEKNALVNHFVDHGVPVFTLDGKGIFDVRVLPRLLKLLKEREVDVLDVHNPYAGVLGRVAAHIAGTKGILYTEHDLAPQKRIKGFHFVTFIPNILTYRLSDVIVSVSQSTHREVQKYNWLRAPARVVYNGIILDKMVADEERTLKIRRSLNIPDDHLIVGHVANMRPEKRQDILIKAAKIVLERCPKTTFLLVGQGPLLNDLKRMAAETINNGNLIFTGFVDDLVGTMNTFDIFTMSSKNEGLPTVVIEAGAMSKPVVSTRAGGTDEIITDGVNGYLTELLNPVDLAEKIIALLQDDDLRKSMGEKGYEMANERFDIRRRTREMEDIYAGLVANSKRN